MSTPLLTSRDHTNGLPRLTFIALFTLIATACGTSSPQVSPTTTSLDAVTTGDVATTDEERTLGTPAPPVEPLRLSSSFTKLTEPGVGGRITSLAFDPVDPDRLYVGGDMLGIAVTDDFGETWQSTTGLASWEIGDITTTPSADGRVWTGSLSGPQASADGIEWALSRNGMPALSDSTYTMATESVLIDPNNDGRLLAFNGNQRNWVAPGAYRDGTWTGDGSVWASEDSGANWSRLATVAPGGNIRAASFNADGTELFAAVANRGFFLSNDDGATWTQTGDGLPHANAYDVTAHPTDPAIAWIAMGEGPEVDGNFIAGGIWKTVDGGTTWNAANDGLSIVSNATARDTGTFHQIVVAPTDPDRLYTSNVAPGQAAVYRSDDGGTTWAIIADGSTSRPNPYQGALRAFDIAVHPIDPDRIAIGSDDTLLGSTNGGADWADLTTREDTAGLFSGHGYTGLVSTDIVFNPTDPDETILLGFDGGNFIQTTNGGTTWRRTVQDISAWGGGVEAAYSPTNGDRIYVLLGQFSNFRGLGVSDDGGTSFSLVAGSAAGLPEVGNVDSPGATGLAVLDGGGTDIVFVTVGSTLFRSDDGAETFSAVPGVLGAIDVAVAAGGNVFVATSGGTLVSVDAGLGFNDAGSPPSGITTIYPSASEPDAIYGIVFRDNGSGGLHRFDGNTWTQLFDDAYAHGVTVDPSNPSNIAVVTTEPAFHDVSSATGVYLSNDGGASWTAVVDGLPMTRLRTAEFDPADPDRLVVGTTGRGFYEISFGQALAE
ncbi:MAG: hypothetical protein ACI81L_000463 [Verrucomicrobiales bacterium]|jgi:hypothetical protein